MKFIDLIYDWQTLVGAFLGPFLAIILSVLAFYIRQKYIKMNERKETHRIIEVSLVRTINELNFCIIEAEAFSKRLRNIIEKINAETDTKKFRIDSTNFFSSYKIYKNDSLPKSKLKSYYLHNQLLKIDLFIKTNINQLVNAKQHYDNLISTNNMLLGLPGIQAIDQRMQFVDNLNEFLGGFEKIVESIKTTTTKLIASGIVYNRLLVSKYFKTIFKYEDVSFKYFNTKKIMNSYKHNVDRLIEMDDFLKKDVIIYMEEIIKGRNNLVS